jgi:hypothetical protein
MAGRTARPAVFVGSSTEGLPIVREVHKRLEDVADVDVWDKAFDPGTWTLDVILTRAQRVDFALFVVSPDDETKIRGEKYHTVRDNVLFEAGVFMGALGPRRTFLLWPTDATRQRLPSDWQGLTRVRYARPKGGRFPHLSRDLSGVRQQIATAGPALRSGYNEIATLKKSLDEHEQLFTDDSALSYLAIVKRAAARRHRPWFTATPVETLIKAVRSDFDDRTADNTFWWLIVLGVLTFDNIDIWNANGVWHWKSSVDFSVFTDRGLALLNELAADRRRGRPTPSG